MRVRLVPFALAVMLPILAFYFYITPTNSTVAALETRIALAGTQADTIAAASMIEPRVQRERAAIAARLLRVQILSIPGADARFLGETAALARRSSVTLGSVLTKGKPAPFGSTASPAPALPHAVPEIVPGTTVRSQPLTVKSLADGMTLPRTITVSGSLVGILRFLDGLGSLPTPVLVKTITLTQGDRLQATMDCDLVIVDANELREAKRVPPPGGLTEGSRT